MWQSEGQQKSTFLSKSAFEMLFPILYSLIHPLIGPDRFVLRTLNLGTAKQTDTQALAGVSILLEIIMSMFVES